MDHSYLSIPYDQTYLLTKPSKVLNLQSLQPSFYYQGSRIDSAGIATFTPGTNAAGINVTTAGDPAYGIKVESGGAAITNPSLWVYNNGASTAALAFLEQDQLTATGDVLHIQNDGSGRSIYVEGGGIVEKDGVLRSNLLTNSGFDVWSNSGLSSGRTIGRQSDDFNVGSAILDNDGSAIGSWNTTATRCTVTVSGGEFIMTDDGTGSDMRTEVQLSGLTAGKLYKFSVQLENGTGTWGVATNAYVRVWNSAKSATLATAPTQTEASGMEDYSVIWEASSETDWIILSAEVSGGQTVKFDNVYVIEVTPGCVATGVLGPDGWEKSSYAELKRVHSDGATEAVTKQGSFYAIEVVSSGNSNYDLYTKTMGNGRFLGRTVTFGAWVKTDAASQVKLNIYDSGARFSDLNTGAGWEWLEVTRTITSTTGIRLGFFITNTKTAYISQPMLVFGSAIGSGNYSRPSGEIVWLEKAVASNLFEATGVSNVSVTTLNLEADSNGKIPKGAKAVNCFGYARDSGSAAADTYLLFRADANASYNYSISTAGLTDNAYARSTGWQACSSDGDVDYTIVASGGGTFDPTVSYKGVQLR